jgi:TPR repeat protein
MMYAAGRGVPQNDVEALALYSTAANQGYAPATANLAQAYADGRGIARDEKTAQFLLSAIDEKPRTGSGIYVDPEH